MGRIKAEIRESQKNKRDVWIKVNGESEKWGWSIFSDEFLTEISYPSQNQPLLLETTYPIAKPTKISLNRPSLAKSNGNTTLSSINFVRISP